MVHRPKFQSPTRRAFLAGSSVVALSGCIGSSGSAGTTDRTTPGGPTRWKVELEAEPTPPISGQFAYVAAGERIHAYTHASGDEVWTQSLPGSGVHLLEAGNLIHVVSQSDESPSLFGRNLTITAFDPETGEEEWQSEIGKQRILATDSDHLYVNATTDVENMPVTISALDADNGTQIWNQKLKTPSQIRTRQQRLYLANDDGVYALDSRDGSQKWHFEWSEFGYNSFAVGPNTVVGVEGSIPGGLTLHVLGRDGEHQWSFEEGRMIGLTLYEGTLFAGGSQVAAFEADTGEITWTREHQHSLYDAPITGDAIVYGGDQIRAFDLQGGSMHWSFGVEFGYLSPVVVRDQTIYVLSSQSPSADDHGVIGLDETSGEEKWRLESESALTEIAAGSNGVYVCEESGVMYGLS